MGEFLSDLTRYPFLQHALLAGALAGVACGVIGSYVVTKKISTIAGSIAHTVLGGLGAARYVQVVHGWDWFHPLYGAVLAALFAAMAIGVVTLKARQREDTVIGALWAIGMAVGILFISRTPGYNEDLMSYLFGNILMVSDRDLWLIAGLDLAVVAIGAVFYNQFLAICFDEEFARLRGVRVEWFYLLLLCLTALTVVLLVTVVGILMVIALITLPVLFGWSPMISIVIAIICYMVLRSGGINTQDLMEQNEEAQRQLAAAKKGGGVSGQREKITYTRSKR